jgi:hypothetical protein
MDEICFSKNDVKLYMMILIVIIAYFAYIHFHRRKSLTNVGMIQLDLQNKIANLQNELLQQQKGKKESDNANLLKRIYNPLIGPSRLYPGGRLNSEAVRDYQMIGFLYNDDERYPLFGRQMYRGKSDKWEYYAIDETRNRLKLPFKSKNDTELYDGDTVIIPGVINSFTVKIYDYDEFRYDDTI